MKRIKLFKKRENIISGTGQAHGRPPDENYQDSTKKRLWYHIRCWCRQRPFWGACCVLLASLLILWSPISLLRTGIVPASSVWAGLVVGGLLFAMGLVEMLAPSHALTAGAAGVALSILSLITALGGFGIGMLLGVIGSSCAVAWKPARKSMSRLVFSSVFGCSLVMMLGLTTLIAGGRLAIATPIAPLIGPFTVFTGRIECHNSRSVTAISRVDHRTPVELTVADFCIAQHVVITKRVLGATIRITQAESIQRGVTSETVASQSTVSQIQKGALIAIPGGLMELAGVDVETNIVAQELFSSVESVTNYGTTISFV